MGNKELDFAAGSAKIRVLFWVGDSSMTKKPKGNGKKKPAKKPLPLAKKSPSKKRPPKTAPARKSTEPTLRKSPIPIHPTKNLFPLPSFLPGNPSPGFPEYDFLGDLPESYGTRRLFLTARDPRCLFAYWDFTWHQLRDAEKESPEGKVYLQIYIHGRERVHQIHIHPGSREWYLPVDRPATLFQAELGYYRSNGSFQQLAVSGEALTPRDDPSPNHEIQFVTIPFHYSFQQLWGLIRSHVRPGEALARALARLQQEGHPFPFAYALRRFLASGMAEKIFAYLGEDMIRRHRMASFEMTEILRLQLETCPKPGSSQLHGTSPGNPPPFA
jgi:hypothetical protein